ncbi:ATP-binding protein [Luteimonas sp. R10]|uniref:ATP-binding protein n=1 Tax=Luteimonas sp. R10 TaxID=3108176 RepID=UPI00308AC7E7|nr:ATP-binding protein [Luteimonas sp. R10]
MLLWTLAELREGVLLCDPDGSRIYANPAADILCRSHPLWSEQGLRLDDMLPPDALRQAGEGKVWSDYVPFGEGRMLAARLSLCSEGGSHYLLLLQDPGLVRDDQDLLRRHAELNVRLTAAQEKLLQAEKMASIGQLAAGVAHEINNPIGYVHSNLGSLQEYLSSLFALIDAYERALRSPDPQAQLAEIDQTRERLDIDFISRDLPQLMTESREGIERVTRIVRDLKDFSRSDRDSAWKLADLHAGLDSTINIVWNELRYKADLEKRYGELPLVECLQSELNQVFMNLLLNAGQAIAERGVITVSSGRKGDEVWVEIADTGGGIHEEMLQRIFDPFFTTKPVGTGTGLGLSISYGIVAKHHGRIEVDSVSGEGSRFRVSLPVRQPQG